MKTDVLDTLTSRAFECLCITTSILIVHKVLFNPEPTAEYVKVFLGLHVLTIVTGIAKCFVASSRGAMLSSAFLSILWVASFITNTAQLHSQSMNRETGKEVPRESQVAPQ